MMHDIRARAKHKLSDFIVKEDGGVGIKAPLSLGVVLGSAALAQLLLAPTAAQAHNECWPGNPCQPPSPNCCCRFTDPRDNSVHQHCYSSQFCAGSGGLGGTCI